MPETKPLKTMSRVVPDFNGDFPFRTAFKTRTFFGTRYYADVVMPSDLGIDAFEEDLKPKKGRRNGR